jgi:hypothetical protein
MFISKGLRGVLSLYKIYSHCDMAEMLLRLALNTHQSIFVSSIDTPDIYTAYRVSFVA